MVGVGEIAPKKKNGENLGAIFFEMDILSLNTTFEFKLEFQILPERIRNHIEITFIHQFCSRFRLFTVVGMLE